MTLSRADFNRQCIEFVRLCQEFADSWSLMKRAKDSQPMRVPLREMEQLVESVDELVLTKTEQLKNSNNDEIYSYEYSVMFSESYEVPVMYFCVSDQGE